MAQNQIYVSIIVPVYKVEKYISSCIESIINQTYKKFELLLIDDGSPDNCGKICDEYAKRDMRIKVYHKANGGLSDARNYGINHAQGNYLVFVDSDDFVASIYLETLVSLIKEFNADVACVDSILTKKRNISSQKSITEVRKCVSGIDAIEICFRRIGFGTSACGKIYKKELFIDIRFPEGKLYEDSQTIPYIFAKCTYVAYSNLKLYVYYMRAESITHSEIDDYHMKFFDDFISVIKYIDKNYPELHDAAVCRYCCDSFSIFINRLLFNSNYKKRILEAKNKSKKYWEEGLKNPYISNKKKFQLWLLLKNETLYKFIFIPYEWFKKI